MDDQTRSFLRSIAAIAFVGVVAVVLALPVIRAGEPSGRRVRAPSPPKTEAQPRSESPDPKESDEPADVDRTIARVGTWPAACLKPTEPPSPPGSIAAASSDRISIATPTSLVTTLPGRAPLMWSPSGRYLAWGRGRVYDVSAGRHVPGVGRRLDSWTWSPVSDCLIGLAGSSLLVAPAGERPVEFLTGDVSAFSVTPEGRFLAAFRRNGSFVGFDLRRGTVAPRRRSGPIFEGPAPFGCSGLPEGYVYASCAPNSRFGVAIRNPDGDEGLLGRLWLVDANGDPIRAIATGPYEDTAPEWGPARTGVLFLRRPAGKGLLEVWYLPEGGNPSPTPLMVTGISSLITHESFRPGWHVDWDLTPPRGDPVVAN